MYQRQIRVAVALIIIIAHAFIFLAGLLLGIFGSLTGTETLQVILIGSPILTTTAAAAIAFALRSETETDRGARVSNLFAIVVLFVPLIFVAFMCIAFLANYYQVNGFGPEQLKIALAGIETSFGAFLGAISNALFGRMPGTPSPSEAS